MRARDYSMSKYYLSLCPYCRGEPVLREVGDWRQYYMYFCSKCKQTPVQLNEARITERGARKIWNIRCKTAIEEMYRNADKNYRGTRVFLHIADDFSGIDSVRLDAQNTSLEKGVDLQ